MAILGLLPATLSADILAAINTPGDSTFSTVNFFDPLSLTLGSSFSASVILEGIALGGNSDIYVSSGNTVYHYDLTGNLLGTGTIGNDDVVGLSYHNGHLWAASNSPATKGSDPTFNVTQLDPSSLAVLNSFQTTAVGSLTGISVLKYGIYLTGSDGIVLTNFSGTVLQNSGMDTEFGPVSAVPHAVYTSFFDEDPAYEVAPFMSDLSDFAELGSTPGPVGVAGVDADDFFVSDGFALLFLSDIVDPNAYIGAETDNFGNLSYEAGATLPTAAPEPATLGSMGLAVIALLFVSRRFGKACLTRG